VNEPQSALVGEERYREPTVFFVIVIALEPHGDAPSCGLEHHAVTPLCLDCGKQTAIWRGVEIDLRREVEARDLPTRFRGSSNEIQMMEPPCSVERKPRAGRAEIRRHGKHIGTG
jgi:hypothetical protein